MLGPAERLCRPPDAMQDDAQLSGQRNPCFATALSLGDSERPILQFQRFFEARHHGHGRLAQSPEALLNAVPSAELTRRRAEKRRCARRNHTWLRKIYLHLAPCRHATSAAPRKRAKQAHPLGHIRQRGPSSVDRPTIRHGFAYFGNSVTLTQHESVQTALISL